MLAREWFHIKAKLRKTAYIQSSVKAAGEVSMLPSEAHRSLCICHVLALDTGLEYFLITDHEALARKYAHVLYWGWAISPTESP